jgi:hypothetical protein
MNRSGRAMVVWTQDDGTRDNVRATLYTPGPGWPLVSIAIEQRNSNAQAPDVAIDPDGHAVAAWVQDGDSLPDADIRSNRYVVGSGWGVRAYVIEEVSAALSGVVEVGIDDDGDAIAVWTLNDGGHDSLWTNRADSGRAWGVAQLLESEDPDDVDRPALAVMPGGDAIAVWQQNNQPQYSIFAARFNKE